jgi:hypothetical protein
MITARFGLDDGVAAMRLAAKGEDAKVLIHPQGLDEPASALDARAPQNGGAR